MALEPYRRLLAVPGVRVLIFLGFFARVPVTAIGLTLTLHVLNGLGLNFFEAGFVGAAGTVGTAIGAPVAGRFVDRRGLRPMIAVTTAVQLVFWSIAPVLPYVPLAVLALVAGIFSLPVFGVMRQCVAAKVPADLRRTGFAMDSMAVELSYMVGPAVAVALVTMLSSTWAMYAVGAGLVASGVALFALNPPTLTEEEAAQEPVPRREWFGLGMLTLLGVAGALTFVLTATELSLVAQLKGIGATEWTGLVISMWGAFSLIGGFVYGGLPKEFSPLVMIGALCALTVPLGLVGGGWWWLCLALIPAGLLCAPSLSATVDTVNRWVPAGSRGEAMGLHGMALTIGVAAAGPVTGGIVDAYGPGWAFGVCGGIGVLIVLIAIPFWRSTRQSAVQPAVIT